MAQTELCGPFDNSFPQVLDITQRVAGSLADCVQPGGKPRLRCESADVTPPQCGVKLTVDLVSLDCAHLYCRGCFARKCGDATQRGAFAELSCCGVAFPDYLLRQVLSEATMNAVVDARFASGVRPRGDASLLVVTDCGTLKGRAIALPAVSGAIHSSHG